MRNLLLNSHPLIVLPELAVEVGLNEAIVLQQLHYWIQKSTNVKDGHVWVYNTYEDWRKQFPFWSISTIRRTLSSLETKGYIITGKFNKLQIDNTKWYRVSYDMIDSIEPESVNRPPVQNEQTTGSNWTDGPSKMNKPLPEITSENTTEKKDSRPQQAADTKKASKVYEEDSDAFLLADFFYRQILKNDPEHKKPNLQRWADVIRKILELDGRDRVEVKQIIKFVQNDDFEMVNVLSPDKLRKRYDNLKLKMYKANGTAQNQAGGSSNGFDDFLQAGGQ